MEFGLLFALLALVSVNNADWDCFPRCQNITRCMCNDENSGCVRYVSPLVLGQIYGKHVPYKVVENVESSSLSHISMSPATQDVVIRDTHVKTLSDDVFKSAKDSLQCVRFKNSQLEKIPSNSLQGLKNLTELSIRATATFSKVIKGQLDLLPLGVKFFFFEDNSIDYIEQDSFYRFPNLEAVSFVGNYLKSIPYRIFPDLVRNSIYFEDNFFTEIPIEALRNCVSPLMSLHMDQNNIKHLPEDKTKPLLKMDVFEIQTNPLECGCEMKWIADYYKGQAVRFGPDGTCVTGGKYRKGENPSGFSKWNFPDCTD